MAEMTMIDAIREAMDEELARDARVFITGEDVGKRGGGFPRHTGLLRKIWRRADRGFAAG